MVRGLARRWLTSRSVKKRRKVGATGLIGLPPAATARAGQRPAPAVPAPPTGTSRSSAGRDAPDRSTGPALDLLVPVGGDRKSTRLNSSLSQISYAVFCLKKKTKKTK